ncbi:MAG: acyl-CoA thioesterase [Saprospiraceae bacterium]|nr:acyl-CoA thioesterase [Saprospiraceae bacterium]
MFRHKTNWRVRYSETDRMGYVYYGNYPMYYETGRVEALRSLGLSYQKMEDEMGIFMPVMSMNCRYIRPCFYDELLSLETTILSLTDNTIHFQTNVFKENGKLANNGLVILCFVERETKSRMATPSVLFDLIQPYQNDNQ